MTDLDLVNSYPTTVGGVLVQAFKPRLSVTCLYCGAQAGSDCRTPSGKTPRDGVHRPRWELYASGRRSGRFYVEMRADDPQTGLSRGDILLAARYAFDSGKVTILRRLSDGLDPNCNQYVEEIRFLSFAR